MSETPLCGETVRDLMKTKLQISQSTSPCMRRRISPSSDCITSAASSRAPEVQHLGVGAGLRESTHPYHPRASPSLHVFLLTASSGEEAGPLLLSQMRRQGWDRVGLSSSPRDPVCSLVLQGPISAPITLAGPGGPTDQRGPGL